jgi:hypothetical protein
VKEGKKTGAVEAILKRIKGSEKALLYIVLVGVALVLQDLQSRFSHKFLWMTFFLAIMIHGCFLCCLAWL